MFVSSIVHFAPNSGDKFVDKIKSIDCVDLHQVDDETGKAIIVIECEGDEQLGEIKKEILEGECVHDVAYHAFYFEDEVNEALENGKFSEFDINELLKDRQ